ncbi:MAG: hypothetical protein JXR37_14590 [Kiritimatiellae bacterium]|nr:hypothetical protein [Kiritimatiellia bacterium]
MHISRPSRTACVLALPLFLTLAAPAQIPLHIDRGGLTGGEAWPMGTGIPLKPGQARSVQTLAIAGETAGPVPAEFEVRTRYADGSIQWLWTDFLAPADESYRLCLNGPRAPLPAPGVRVFEDAQRVGIDNGALCVEWRKSHATPVAVRIPGGAPGIPVAAGDGQGVYLVDNRDRRATLGGTGADLQWKIETANRLRAVVRVEGWYTTSEGERVARSIVRYHLYWNQPWLNIEHSFIVTRDNDETWYKEIGIHFPGPASGGSTARFGRKAKTPCALALDTPGADAWIYQSGYPHHYTHEPKCSVGRAAAETAAEQEAEGWADLNGGRHGMVAAVRDFAPQFPKELNAGPGGITAKLWAGRDGRVLDYNPRTLARDDWGEKWVANIEVCGQGVEGMKISAEQLKNMNVSAVGVARTHSLLVGYYHGPYDEERALQWYRAFQTPPIVYPDPRWTCHVDTRVFPPMAAKGEGGPAYDDIERYIAAAFEEYTSSLRLWPMAGWIEWGMNPYLEYHRWPDKTIYARWYRLNSKAHYNLARNIWVAWIRSGERKYLDFAQRNNRFNADLGVVHWGGGKEKKRKGLLITTQEISKHTPLYWHGSGAFSCGPGGNGFVVGFAYEYLLRDSRWLKDAIDLITPAVLAAFRPDHSFTGDGQFGVLSQMMNLYRVNQNEELAQKIKALHGAITDINTDNGVNHGFYGKGGWWPRGRGGRYAKYEEMENPGGAFQSEYKYANKLIAMIEYADLFGEEQAKQIAVKAALWRAKGEKHTPPSQYQDSPMRSAYAMRGYLWTRDPDCLETFRYQLTGIRAMFQLYEKLPPEKKGLARYRQYAGGPKSTSSSPPAYAFFELPQYAGHRYKDRAFLGFSGEQNGVPLFAMPAAIWGMMQVPGDRLSRGD